MLSKLTLIGLHEYSEGAIWDDLELPEGIDKDILINEILRQNGEFCTIYPDEDFLKLQIQIWSKKWKPNFTKWVDVLNKEYEALWNVDVHDSFREDGTNEENSAKEGSASGVAGSIAGSITRGNKDSRESSTTFGNNSGSTNTATSGNGVSIGNNQNDKYKAAYDASTVQQTEKEVVSTSLSNSEHNSSSTSEYGSNSSSSSGSYSEITSLSSSESTSESSSSDNSESMTANSEHTIKTENWKRGNQGITMSQELLLAELNVRRFNLYSQIADIFASEFCVCVYF